MPLTDERCPCNRQRCSREPNHDGGCYLSEPVKDAYWGVGTCHGVCENVPNPMPSNIEGSLKERIKAYLKNVPARFYDDQDHTVGGFVTKQQVLEALIPVWESELHKAEERGMRMVIETIKKHEADFDYFGDGTPEQAQTVRGLLNWARDEYISVAESLIPKE